MTSEVIVAEWAKNGRERLRVRLDSFKGQVIVDCRSWYEGADGLLKPGRGGLTLSVRHLPKLAAAMGEALAVAKASGLITETDPQSQ